MGPFFLAKSQFLVEAPSNHYSSQTDWSRSIGSNGKKKWRWTQNLQVAGSELQEEKLEGQRKSSA